MAAEDDIRSYLGTQSFSTTFFLGPSRPPQPPAVPLAACFIQQTGGPPPEPFMDGTRSSYRYMRCQIRVRGNPNEYQVTRDLASAIWSAMQQAPTTMTGSYTRVTCDQSMPLYMGRDDTGCHEYAVNATLEKRLA